MVDEAEDGGVCADAQRQRENGDCGKSRTPAEHTRRIPQVLHEIGQGSSSGNVSFSECISLGRPLVCGFPGFPAEASKMTRKAALKTAAAFPCGLGASKWARCFTRTTLARGAHQGFSGPSRIPLRYTDYFPGRLPAGLQRRRHRPPLSWENPA